MATTIISSNNQKRVKDCFASSPTVGLALRCNGEQKVEVLDHRGNIYKAYIAAPTVAPTEVSVDTGGNITANKYVAYVYVYAATTAFPFVENAVTFNGSLAPRSNPSDSLVCQADATDSSITISVTKTTADGVDKIWIFRTTLFDTSELAETAADAGLLYYLGSVDNDGSAGTESYEDNTLVDSGEQIELDNFEAPQFRFAVYEDPYWWGFANQPFVNAATWTSGGTVTITGSATWFDGRDGQNLSLSGITTGGIDGKGTFIFKWVSSTTGYATIDGSTAETIASGSGTVTIQGPATTLYRSKYRNPFSWGKTTTIGEVSVPEVYAFKVGGGVGTAIAAMPNEPLLKLDTEFPAKCFTLNLMAAGTSEFESTLRTISNYSVSAHHSQFVAATATGNTVLWGIDYKNFAILQCDGVSQIPISQSIPRFMRSLSTDKSKQVLSHGVYDPRTECNCLWVPSANSISQIDYLIYQHVPTGTWGIVNDHDILASAAIEDSNGTIKTFVGTESGILGQAFVENRFNNWLPDTGLYTGTVASATSTTITRSGSDSFNTSDAGMIGNWCLVTDASGGTEQWAKISARTSSVLTFNLFRSYTGGGTAAFNPTPSAGYKFYVGLIESSLIKYFDFSQPSADKRFMELWLTQQNSDPTTAGTLIRFYRERSSTYTKQFATLQNDDSSDSWFTKDEIPSDMVKSFGVEIINRGYLAWRFFNMTIKAEVI